ncbi:MAG: hypothetical protein KJ831_09395, partial [Candidatus Eisenbacteria bacterium]|nr:hypothetical protein [Candidatus Eisenbacteria bacterium]
SWANYVRPMIGLTSAATEQTVAHEVGHYMNHILTSDDQYLLIENTAPDGHGLGDLHDGRTTIIEDFAYFSQFLLRGSVDLADPTEPGSMYRQIRPSVVDAPSAEGFGCVLLSRLWSADQTIGDINAPTDRRPVPTVNLGMSEILSLISLGATNINQLKADVETYLTGVGKADRLPVILERIGWRYLFKVRLVDSNGDPLQNVTVRKFTKANGVEYAPYTKLAITDDDGYIYATHAFPGETTLRLEFQGDSIDVPVTIDSSLPTDQTIDLGEITVGNALNLSLAKYGAVSLQIYLKLVGGVNGPQEFWGSLGSMGGHNNRQIEGNFSGSTFSGARDWTVTEYGLTSTYHEELEATVDPESGAMTSYRFKQTWSNTSNPNNYSFEFQGSGTIPMVSSETGNDYVYYAAHLYDATVCNTITRLEYTNNDEVNGYVSTVQSYNCTEPGGAPSIRVTLGSTQN